MVKIDVEFDVFKALTSRRLSEQHTENMVLRELLGLPVNVQAAPTPIDGSGEGWTSHGVTFSNGTELRATHKGRSYKATIVDGQFTSNGVAYTSPSLARWAVTQTGGNGWWFWTVKKVDSDEWESIGFVRQRANSAFAPPSKGSPEPADDSFVG